MLDDGRTAQQWAEDQYRTMLAAVRGRDSHAMALALEQVSEGLLSIHFTEAAAPFASSCYGTYIGAFHEYLGRSEGDLVAATWEQFELAAPHLDALYAQHAAERCV